MFLQHQEKQCFKEDFYFEIDEFQLTGPKPEKMKVILQKIICSNDFCSVNGVLCSDFPTLKRCQKSFLQ